MNSTNTMLLIKNSRVVSFYKNFKNIKFVHQTNNKLPFPDNYFDRIIISHCLEHIVYPENVLLDIYSKLKKGGSATISFVGSRYYVEDWKIYKCKFFNR